MMIEMMIEVKDKNDPILKDKIKKYPIICLVYKLVTEGKLGIVNDSNNFKKDNGLKEKCERNE